MGIRTKNENNAPMVQIQRTTSPQWAVPSVPQSMVPVSKTSVGRRGRATLPGPALESTSLRVRGLLLIPLLSCFLSSCGGAIGGGVAAIFAGGEGDGSNDAPPTASVLSVDNSNPDQVDTRVLLSNDDKGKLGLKVEFIEVAGGSSEADTPRQARVSISTDKQPNGGDPGDLPADEEINVTWDARTDLDDGSSAARLLITPLEDGREGARIRTAVFRAGNTPTEVANASLASEGSRVDVLFDLKDQEADPVRLLDTAIAVGSQANSSPSEEDFVAIPRASFVNDVLSADFSFVSRPEGARVTFSFDAATLGVGGDSELARVSQPGFVGRVAVRFQVRDYPQEDAVQTTSSFLFDNNNPPTVSSFSVESTDVLSGVIPLRYILSDEEQNPADLRIDVDYGQGFVRANEFPGPLSQSRGARTRAIEEDSGNDGRDLEGEGEFVHTFLWDAFSQLPFHASTFVTFRLQARDAELGPQLIETAVVGLPGVRRLESPSELKEPLVADFNADGVLDTAGVLGEALEVRSGGPPGTEGELLFRADYAGRPEVVGDFDGNGTLDLVTSIDTSAEIAVVHDVGKATKEARELLIPYPFAVLGVEKGQFDGNAYEDLLLLSDTRIAILLGGEKGLAREPLTLEGFGCREFDHFGDGGLLLPPLLCAVGDFDGDGRDSVAVVDWDSAAACEKAVRNLDVKVAGLATNNRSFTIYQRPSCSGQPMAVAVGSFDSDSFEDLAVLAGCSLLQFHGSPRGLQEGQALTTCRRLREVGLGLTVGQYTADSLSDVLVINDDSDLVFLGDLSRVLEGSAVFFSGSEQGLKRRGPTIVLGIGPGQVLVEDVDGDGRSEAFVGNFGQAFDPGGVGRRPECCVSMSVLKLGEAGVVEAQSPLEGGSAAMGFIDGDADGRVELLLKDGETFEAFTRSFEGVDAFSSGRDPVAVGVGDVNGDQRQDVIEFQAGRGDNDRGKSVSASVRVHLGPKQAYGGIERSRDFAVHRRPYLPPRARLGGA